MNETKATRYQRLRRRARVAEVVSAGAALALVACSPIAGRLSDAIHGALRGLSGGTERTVALTLFVVAVVGFVDLATLPASLYAATRVDGPYRGAAASAEDVFAMHAQTLIVAVPSAWMAGAVVLVSGAIAGSWWWVVAGPMLAVALLAALHLAPAVLAGLGDVRPLGRSNVVAQMRDLARRAGVSIGRVMEWQVTGPSNATALVTGLGGTRQILVASDLVRDWSDDEIAVVVAHELGHVVRGDLWRTLIVDACVMWAALLASHLALGALAGWGTPPVDLASLPLVALVSLVAWTAATPVRHAQSRAHERQADRFALELTGRVDAFGATLRRLSSRHLVEERPSLITRWFYHRHPSVAERLEAARTYQGQRAEGKGQR